MDHDYLNTKFKAEWQIKRINESQKGIFEVIENEPTISILKRLNLLGRDNWKKIQLNYFVSRE